MNRSAALLIASTLLLLSSCKKEEEITAESIFTHYEISYDRNQAITFVRASFRFENDFGKAIELTEGASVKFNNEALVWNSAYAEYQLDLPDLVPEGTFKYTASNGITHTNSIDLKEIDFPLGLDSVSILDDFQFNWAGSPLGVNESVTLWIDPLSSESVESFYASGNSVSAVNLAANRLLLIPPGLSDWIMNRSYSPPIDEAPEAGGSITAIFRPESIEVMMVD
jgi:hypothetical protein